MKILKIALVAVVFLMITNQSYAVEFGENSWKFDKSYINAITLGSTLITAGYGTKAHIYSSLNFLGTDIVDAVKCARILTMRTEKGEFSELWIAQDLSGNLYILKYWEGEDPGPVVLGKDKAILFMPINPKVGDTVFGDKTVIEVGVTVPKLSTGLGPFTNCLKTFESDGDIVYIAPGLGDVKKEYVREIGGFELKEVILGANPSDGASTIDDTLKITMPYLIYNRAKLDFTFVLESYPNIADPTGFYWKLTALTNNN